MKNAILLKYGELALRGKNRYLFENRLIRQIRDILNDECSGSLKIKHRVSNTEGVENKTRWESDNVKTFEAPLLTSPQTALYDESTGSVQHMESKADYQFAEIVNSDVNENKFAVIKEQGRILIEPLPGSIPKPGWIDAITQRIKMVIGLTGICGCLKIDNTDINSLCEAAAQYMCKYHCGNDISFKVETRRANKNYPMHSQEISSEIGGYILDNVPNTKVDVHNPDVILYIEIRNRTYIFSNTEKCIGGLPVGSSGRGLLMLSGGIDSPVAGFLAAKRGVELEAVYFHSPPYTSERAKLKVLDLVEVLSEYAGQIKLHVVPFTAVQLFLRDNVPLDKLTVFLKRAMLDIAQQLAIANKCRVIINGDSIGQVASQNLTSMAAIGSVSSLPLIRPLACFDKQEIVDLAKKIRTYDISIRPYDDCCTLFVAKHPELSPKQSVIEGIERGLIGLKDLISNAIEGIEIFIN